MQCLFGSQRPRVPAPPGQVTQGARGHSEKRHHSGWPPCEEEILLWLTVVSHPQPACPCPRSPSASSPSKPKVTWLLESALGFLCSNTWQGPLWLALVGDLPPLMEGSTRSQEGCFFCILKSVPLSLLHPNTHFFPPPPPMWFSERKEQMGFSRKVTTCLLHLPSPLSMPSGGSALWLPWQQCRGNLLLLEGQRCAIWVMLGWPVSLWPLFSRNQRAAFSTWVMDLETLECLLQLQGLSASP